MMLLIFKRSLSNSFGSLFFFCFYCSSFTTNRSTLILMVCSPCFKMPAHTCSLWYLCLSRMSWTCLTRPHYDLVMLHPTFHMYNEHLVNAAIYSSIPFFKKRNCSENTLTAILWFSFYFWVRVLACLSSLLSSVATSTFGSIV